MATEDTQKTLGDLLTRPTFDPASIGELGDDPEEEAPIGDATPPTPGQEETPIAEAPSQPEPSGKKYQSWEAAEAGAREAQSWGTKKAQEAAELRREMERLRVEREEEQRQLAEANRPKPLSKEERAARLKQALDSIDELDPDSSDYTTQRATILAEAMDTPTSVVDEFTIESKVKAELERYDSKRQEAQTQRTLIRNAEALAVQAGLSMKKGHYDHTMFWDALSRAPMGEGVTLEQQVDAMVKEVVSRKEAFKNDLLSGLDATTKKRLQQTPLARHSTATPNAQPSKTEMEESPTGEPRYSVSDIMAKQRESRTI